MSRGYGKGRMIFRTRSATPDDVPVLAPIWFEGWHRAHHDTLPAELRQHRTEASFAARLTAELHGVRVIDCEGQAKGFAILRGNEVYQFYIALELLGTGAAQALMRDAEADIRARGFETAILNCADGNARAARFYEKCGWRSAGLVDVEVDAGGRPFPIRAVRFEKRLGGAAAKAL
jgi:GNAT superfamily N-acetyltransferase